MAKKKAEPYQQQPKLADIIRREKDSYPVPDPTIPKAALVTSVLVLDTPSREASGVEMGERLRHDSVPKSLMDKITGKEPEGK